LDLHRHSWTLSAYAPSKQPHQLTKDHGVEWGQFHINALPDLFILTKMHEHDSPFHGKPDNERAKNTPAIALESRQKVANVALFPAVRIGFLSAGFFFFWMEGMTIAP